MSLKDFIAILGKVPKHIRIDFSGMVDPWANTQATAMLQHTLTSGYAVGIYTTLYGMSPEDGREVVGLLADHAPQIEVLCLHLPDRNGNMRGRRYSAEYETNLRCFLALGSRGVLRNFQAMTMDSGGTPRQDLDHMGIRLGRWEGDTRAGNVGEEALSGQKVAAMPEHHGAVSCAFTPFYDQNVCLPNGDVVLCCMDYSIKHRIGNLLAQDYYEMFASGGLTSVISKNMDPQFSRESLCKTCDRAKLHKIGQVKQYWVAA